MFIEVTKPSYVCGECWSTDVARKIDNENILVCCKCGHTAPDPRNSIQINTDYWKRYKDNTHTEGLSGEFMSPDVCFYSEYKVIPPENAPD